VYPFKNSRFERVFLMILCILNILTSAYLKAKGSFKLMSLFVNAFLVLKQYRFNTFSKNWSFFIDFGHLKLPSQTRIELRGGACTFPTVSSLILVRFYIFLMFWKATMLIHSFLAILSSLATLGWHPTIEFKKWVFFSLFFQFCIFEIISGGGYLPQDEKKK